MPLNSLKPEGAWFKVKVPDQVVECFRGLFLMLLRPLKVLRFRFKCTGSSPSPQMLRGSRFNCSELCTT